MEKKRYTIEDLIHNPSFQEWVEGTASNADTRKWDRWISESDENREIAQQATASLSGFEIASPELPDIDREWSRVKSKLKNKVTKPRDTPQNVVEKSNAGDNINWFFRIAAILLVGFFVGWALFSSLESPEVTQAQEVIVEKITTGFGEKKTISLSDGSTIILAAGSELTYRKDWLTKPVKQLELEGEAYFSIVPTAQQGHPKFIVETEDGDAAVWGTKFSVSTYGEGTQVVLEEGEVRVTVGGIPDTQSNEHVMIPGQLLRFSNAQTDITTRNVNTLIYTSWASDKLVFDETPVSHLVERIQRTYDVRVEVRGKEILERKLSGSVNFRDLDSLIRAVSEVLKIDISRTERTVYINGSNLNRVNQ